MSLKDGDTWLKRAAPRALWPAAHMRLQQLALYLRHIKAHHARSPRWPGQRSAVQSPQQASCSWVHSLGPRVWVQPRVVEQLLSLHMHAARLASTAGPRRHGSLWAPRGAIRNEPRRISIGRCVARFIALGGIASNRFVPHLLSCLTRVCLALIAGLVQGGMQGGLGGVRRVAYLARSGIAWPHLLAWQTAALGTRSALVGVTP